MQIMRCGFAINALAADEARREFARTECAVLPGFLAGELARGFARDLELIQPAPAAHRRRDQTVFADDLTYPTDTGVFHALHLLLNNPLLFGEISRITGCGPIGCFSGRIYRNMPSSQHHLDWHDDTQSSSRLIGLSISLTPGPYEGGVFRIRRKISHEILAEVSQAQAGNAHIFRIDPAIEHCVTPVLGEQPRTAFAGWFQSSPDHNSLIRTFWRGADK